MENKKIYITMYGYTLIIAIIINSLIEYRDYINKLIPKTTLIPIVFILFVIFVSIIYIKCKNEFNTILNPFLLVNMSVIIIIFIWAVVIRLLFMMHIIAAIIVIIISVMFVIGYNVYNNDFVNIDEDSTLLIIPLIIVLMISVFTQHFHPKVLESYNTTHNQVYIQKEKWYKNDIYTVYDTSVDKINRYNMHGLNYMIKDIFARYILKHINKDLKVDVTMYDESTYTYKIMYEDGTIQKFALSDIKLDDEFKNNSIINKFLSEKEAEKSAKLAEQKLENQKETLKNS